MAHLLSLLYTFLLISFLSFFLSFFLSCLEPSLSASAWPQLVRNVFDSSSPKFSFYFSSLINNDSFPLITSWKRVHEWHVCYISFYYFLSFRLVVFSALRCLIVKISVKSKWVVGYNVVARRRQQFSSSSSSFSPPHSRRNINHSSALCAFLFSSWLSIGNGVERLAWKWRR